ncbi:MAG TPA: RNA methyltransferase, partial [Steroidobacteraceae bacterium]|nr:RNA methyltransferase [Steroidobacteraceae bacterium]
MPAAIRIVLIDTTHPGNIGAVARALKNMALDDLALVRPQNFPSAEATARASGAGDLLLRARVYATLEEAIADCGLIVGATARPRMQHFDALAPREAAPRVIAAAHESRVAVLFGSERVGLTNEELAHCNWLIRIPASPEYESLNLAMAVQIVAYELHMARGAALPVQPRDTPLATASEMERLRAHFEDVMTEVGFADRTQAGTHLMSRIRRVLTRAELDQNEVNILRGLLTAIQGKR